MALSAVKTWIAGEILTASDLNAEFSNIYNNGLSVVSPLTGSLDANGQTIILDADADSSLSAANDDQVVLAVGGTNAVKIGHGTSNTSGFIVSDPAAFTATASTDVARMILAASNAITVPAGTTSLAAGLHVAEPNWTATGTITSAVTVYIAGAPTEGGTNNYALWVDAGATKLDGTLEVDGAATLNSTLDVTGAMTMADTVGVTGVLSALSSLELGHASDTTLARVSAGRVSVEGTELGLAGKQSLWVPAVAMRPTVSNGCATLTAVETTAGRPDMQVLDFDASSDEAAQFQVSFPKSWNLGTVTFQAFWTTTATDTDGVAIALQGVAVSDNDTIDVAYGTAVVVQDDALSAAEDLMVTSESGAVTIAGTPADDDEVFFRVFRDVSDTNDDMTEDMRLIGLKLFYTTDLGNDD